MKGGEGDEERAMGDDMGTGMGGGGKSKRRQRGRKQRRSRSRSRSRKVRGGNGVIATAAVPFGLLALQRYFKGSKTSKRGVQRMGNSFKRTFRRRR
jgi:hypothetical protein